MKFKFCGDNDCQDWLLAQISLMSKLSSIKIKIILNEVVCCIISGKLDFEKICKLTLDAKLGEEETKAIVAALDFIITSSTKYETDGDIVLKELQQLGLPREHSVALCKVYSDNFSKIKDLLKEKSLKHFPLNDYSYEIKSFVSSQDNSLNVNFPSLFLNLSGENSVNFGICPDMLDNLICDLNEASQTMEDVNL